MSRNPFMIDNMARQAQEDLAALMAGPPVAEELPMVPDDEPAYVPPAGAFEGRLVRDIDTLLAAYAAGDFDYKITEKDGTTTRRPKLCSTPQVRDKLIVKINEGAVITIRPRR